MCQAGLPTFFLGFFIKDRRNVVNRAARQISTGFFSLWDTPMTRIRLNLAQCLVVSASAGSVGEVGDGSGFSRSAFGYRKLFRASLYLKNIYLRVRNASDLLTRARQALYLLSVVRGLNFMNL